ncbi:MAG: non-homologous end-joining DNA ligase [Acidobacteria bacterium]|jgi:bifunctional non-homologous end joining protein LigD|nr:non-homologous end-joining DNA ligase [Acidobacteriota bacterium]
MKNPGYIKPMFAKTTEKPFDDNEWLFEIKYDGYRAVAELNKEKVKLYSRNGLNFAVNYPGVTAALKKLNLCAVLDGEIVALDDEGHQGFQNLQRVGMDPSIHVQYYVFDLLEYNGENMRELPLLERKERLKKILKQNQIIRYSDHVKKKGKKLFQLAVELNYEGIMAKRMDSEYCDGVRTGNWLKIKNLHEEEAIIVGFTAPRGGRKYFGALLLAVYNKNKELTYIGHTGTGFTEASLKSLYQEMKPLKISQPPIKRIVKPREPVTWIKPVLVCNVKFSEITSEGVLRIPVFLGLRRDKSAEEVIME